MCEMVVNQFQFDDGKNKKEYSEYAKLFYDE